MMGKLINREKLVRAKQQRVQRKQRILEEAGSVFMRMAYTEVTLDTIGQRADVERGIASMYFGSKESLFLVLFRDCLAEWFDCLEQRLSDAVEEDIDRDGLAALLARSVAERPPLTRFLSLLPVVLEQDLEVMEVYRFQRWRSDRMSKVGELIEKKTGAIGSGSGFGLLYRLQLAAAGLETASNPRGSAAFDREDPDLAGLWLDLESELKNTAKGYLSLNQ